MLVVAVNACGLALLFALAASSGRSYGHYLVMFVPGYAVAFGCAVLQVCRAVRNRAAIAVAGVAVMIACVYFPASFGSVHEALYRSTLVESRAEVVGELGELAGGDDVLVVGNECWVYLDAGLCAPVPYAYRSDAMPDAYDAWLSGLIASDGAPAVIAVAEYVDLGVPLHPYREAGAVGGFTLYRLA